MEACPRRSLLGGESAARSPCKACPRRAARTVGRGGPRRDVVLDDQISYKQFIGLGGCGTRINCESFSVIKSNYFSAYNPERKPFFHYAVFADAYGTYDAATGTFTPRQASGIATGQDVLVTLGKTTGASATWQAQLGTLIHEFGHDLGLSHNENGNDGPLGPNSLNAHRSVMNYRFQLSGVPTPWGSSTFRHTYSFGKADCDSCLTSPKLTCVNARNNGACADAPRCDCDVAEWDTLNFAFGNAGLGANAGQPGAAPVDPQDAVRRNQDARGAGKRKSDVARWIGPVPTRSKEARKRAFEAFLATSGRAGEYVLSEDGQELWTREGTHEGK